MIKKVYKIFSTLLFAFAVTACGSENYGVLQLASDDIKGQHIIKINGKTYNGNTQNFSQQLPVGSYEIEITIHSQDGNWIFSTTDNFTIAKNQITYFLADLKRQPTEQQQAKIKAEQQIIELGQSKPKNASRYESNNNGTVLDTTTNLMWKKCAEGLTGNLCDKGAVKKYTWAEAKTFAENSNFANYNDWRIPSYAELRTLINCLNGSQPLAFNDAGYLLIKDDKSHNGECIGNSETIATINETIFPNTPAKRYWTSSLLIDSPLFAWNYNFNLGSIYYDDIKNDNRFRLVRNN